MLVNHNGKSCLLDARTFSCAIFCKSQSSNHDSFPKPSSSSDIFTDTNRKEAAAASAFEPLVKAKDNAVNFKQKVNSENTFLFETPGMRPLTSNVKRKLENVSKLSSLRDSGK